MYVADGRPLCGGMRRLDEGPPWRLMLCALLAWAIVVAGLLPGAMTTSAAALEPWWLLPIGGLLAARAPRAGPWAQRGLRAIAGAMPAALRLAAGVAWSLRWPVWLSLCAIDAWT
jgi:hypothetical protein